VPANRPYTSPLNPDATNEHQTPKKKKAMTNAQLGMMRGMLKSMKPEEKSSLRKQMGY
jgi:hypothetical protein